MKLTSIIKFIIKYLHPVAVLLLIASCLQNPSEIEFQRDISNTAYLLKYFESKGDIINSKLVPITISASMLNSNLDLFKIVDLRSKDDFIEGRIPNSINVDRDSILNFIQNELGDSIFVVLVSETGEISGYVTSLLWSMGYYNVYSLDFGIASWHEDFGKEVIDEMRSLSDNVDYLLNNDNYPKADFSPLPELNISDLSDMDKVIRNRCYEVLNDPFIIEDYRRMDKNSYIICYGNLNLYKAHALFGPMPGKGHPEGAVHYQHALVYDLRSSSYLQTIPSDKKILIYSFSGQLAAFTVAYLRILGYDAYSLRYGGSQLVYERLIWNQFTRVEVFDEEDIMNFSYISGN